MPDSAVPPTISSSQPAGGSGDAAAGESPARTRLVDPDCPVQVIDQRSGSMWASLMAAFRSWELLYLLAVRDLTVRYRQTIVGIGWAVLNPLLMMLVLSVFFGVLGRIGPAGVPYPPFLLSGMVMWRLFESALGRSNDSLISNTALIDKVAFPRFVLPMASVLSPLVDFGISLIVVAGTLAFYGIMPLTQALMLPVYTLITVLSALGFGLWLAGLNAHYRDVTHILQVVLRLGFYASPIIYSLDLVPSEYHLMYALNPMVTVISATRHSLCGSYETVVEPSTGMWVVSLSVMVVTLFSGLFVFNRLEKRIADVL